MNSTNNISLDCRESLTNFFPEIGTFANASDARWRKDCYTENNETGNGSRRDGGGGGGGGPSSLTVTLSLAYSIIFVVGLLGNSLVIFVVARYSKMKTVTNVYILNLSVADGLFLVGLPMLVTTAIVRQWVFGQVLCKIYYIQTCINMFTGTFTLTLMAADRFAAVWYPVKSMHFRTVKFAVVEVMGAWVLSALVMFPVVHYAQHISQPMPPDSAAPFRYSCMVQMPAANLLSAIRIYFVYSLLVGFIIPVSLISIFYALLVVRLRANRLHLRAASEKQRQQQPGRRSVTGLVTTIILVFIICWLPYWCFQVFIIFGDGVLMEWQKYVFQFFTLLSYANSAINPLLYSFTNDNFKKAFVAAFKCALAPLQDERRTNGGDGASVSRLAASKGGRDAAVSGTEMTGMKQRRDYRQHGPKAATGTAAKRHLETQATVMYEFNFSINPACGEEKVEEGTEEDGVPKTCSVGSNNCTEALLDEKH